MNVAYMRQVKRRLAERDQADVKAQKARSEPKWRFVFHVVHSRDLPYGWKPSQSMIAETEDEARIKLTGAINRQLNKDQGLRPEHRRPIELKYLHRSREQ